MNISKDLKKNDKEIKFFLENEIISRKHFQKGRMEASVKQDPYIEQAIGVFKNKTKYVKNIGNIFIGKKSFIGFSNELTMKDVRLPRIKQGLITPDDPFQYADASVRQKLNLLYARDYSMRKDFSIVWKTWRKLDN